MYTHVCAFDRIGVRQDNSVRDNRLVLIYQCDKRQTIRLPRWWRRYELCTSYFVDDEVSNAMRG